jgi:hypothetical protein
MSYEFRVWSSEFGKLKTSYQPINISTYQPRLYVYKFMGLYVDRETRNQLRAR